jgi:hypothetical protein
MPVLNRTLLTPSSSLVLVVCSPLECVKDPDSATSAKKASLNEEQTKHDLLESASATRWNLANTLSSLLAYLTRQIALAVQNNVRLRANRIHLRFEDRLTQAKFPLAVGCALHHAEIFTSDEQGFPVWWQVLLALLLHLLL